MYLCHSAILDVPVLGTSLDGYKYIVLKRNCCTNLNLFGATWYPSWWANIRCSKISQCYSPFSIIGLPMLIPPVCSTRNRFTRDYNARPQIRLGVTAELRLLRGAVALKWQPYSLSHSFQKI
jgi:hypothetical protein